jgi:DNA-directed RNA polymerase beta' subunit
VSHLFCKIKIKTKNIMGQTIIKYNKIMDFKFKESVVPIKKVHSIQFSVLDPKYIEDVSVTKSFYDQTGKKIQSGIFDQTNIYDPVTKQPIIGGVNDPRMGNTMDLENSGSFGHIELARPVYHYGFLNMILTILRSVSYYNSKILLTERDLAYCVRTYKKKKRLKEISKLTSKVKICPITKKPLPLYSKQDLKIVIEHTDPVLQGSFVGKRTLSTLEAYSILEKISDEDVLNLGLNPKFCRPEWMLITMIPVPPPHVRPAVYMSSFQKCEDDLTHKLSDILKSNIALQNVIENNSQPHIIEQFENLLQYHVSTYFDNKIPGQKPSQQRSGKPLKTLRQRLVGKEGRVRGNLMGKRVDQSARTVITGDPNLSMDQVGVPVVIAMDLTIPERVSEHNIQKLQYLVDNGPNKHPGARYVIIYPGPEDQSREIRKIDLKYVKNQITLKPGYVVERHLDDEDVVLFNRQPSLHKMSIMGHRVKVQQEMTFRLNLSCCAAYNADFDGDEMNLHVPQSLVARAEVENLIMVPFNIVGAQSNKPIMGIIQDALLSCSLLTRRDTFIEKTTFMNLIFSVGIVDKNHKNKMAGCPEPCIMINIRKLVEKNVIEKPKNYSSTDNIYYELWTGKQAFSAILPKTLNYSGKSNISTGPEHINTPTDTKVLISKGHLLSGIVDKRAIGSSEGSLIHILFNDIGPLQTKIFIDKIQRIANFWILHNGFSIGIGDAFINDDTMTEVKNILDKVKAKVSKLAQKNLTSTSTAKLEQEINVELNGARDEAGHVILSKLNHNNRFNATVNAGSKGNNLNISQIIGCVGQQNIEGRRVAYGFKKRTLPHYKKNDIGYESRGFIENSYLVGLKPQEFFYHSMAGREGVIDTACKSVTGDTDIIIQENGITIYTQIGKWIDDKMSSENSKQLIQHSKQYNMELLPIDDKCTIYIPTVDENGITSWGLITAVTRHDVSPNLYKITTGSGRSVIVPDTKSLLIWFSETNKFEEVVTSNVKIGNCMPVNFKLDRPPVIYEYVYYGENFELNHENGLFVGLYLADELATITEDSVEIFKGDSRVKEFVDKWFSKKSLKKGSVALTNFLKRFLYNSGSKIVPNEAYSAPDEFVIGLLTAYFNTLGEDSSKTSILATSLKIINGINMLLSRFCIFGEVSIDKEDQFKLDLKTDFKKQNDVILDPIVSIIKIDSKQYPKVYDLTVPSTLNFCIANGLNVRDTADVGYGQRKLVKALEDLSVHCDKTVRDGYNGIVQFLYGEDGIDATYIESQQFDLLNEADFNKRYVTESADPIILKEIELIRNDMNTLLFITSHREPLAVKIADTYLAAPVNVRRIINNCLKVLSDDKSKKLSRIEIIEKVVKLVGNINKHKNQLVAINIRANLASKILFDKKITEKQLDFIVEEIETKFNESIVATGEMVGVIASQSISAPVMQMTLNSFHSSGISTKNVTLGLPRFRELIHISKNIKTPSLTVYLDDTDIVENVKNKLECKYLESFIEKSSIIHKETLSPDESALINVYNFFESDEILSSVGLKIELKNEELEYTNLTLFDIYDIILKDKQIRHNNMTDNIYIMINDDNADKPFLLFYVILEKTDTKDNQDLIDFLKDFQAEFIDKIQLQGLTGISRVFLNEKQMDVWSDKNGFFKNKVRFIETEGSALQQSFLIDGINHKRTMSNNIVEVYEVLGIEAARQTLLNELKMLLSFDGSYVNYRHLSILVDIMTYKGGLMSMTRHGINRIDTGTLVRASFEETCEILLESAMYSQKDIINSVSESVMLGSLPPCGTGSMEILLDENLLKSHKLERSSKKMEVVFEDPDKKDAKEPAKGSKISMKSKVYRPSSPVFL